METDQFFRTCFWCNVFKTKPLHPYRLWNPRETRGGSAFQYGILSFVIAVEPPRNAGWISPFLFFSRSLLSCGTPAKRGVDQPYYARVGGYFLLWNPRETRGGSAFHCKYSKKSAAVEPPRNAGWISLGCSFPLSFSLWNPRETRGGSALNLPNSRAVYAVEPPRNAGWISLGLSICSPATAVEPPRNAGWISSLCFLS